MNLITAGQAAAFHTFGACAVTAGRLHLPFHFVSTSFHKSKLVFCFRIQYDLYSRYFSINRTLSIIAEEQQAWEERGENESLVQLKKGCLQAALCW